MATKSKETAQPTVPQRRWFGRNWKWFLPLSIVLVVVLGGGTAGVISVWPNIKLYHSQAFADTMQELKTNPKIKEALGEPIKMERWLPGGTFEERQIRLNFDVVGPKKKGVVDSTAQFIDNKWSLSRLLIKLPDSNQEINLTSEVLGRGEDGPAKFDPNQKAPTKETPSTKPSDLDLNFDVK